MESPLIRPSERKSLLDIRREWNELAELRHLQIESGRDVSYSRILEPTVIRLLKRQPLSSALDVGCGVGVLTRSIREVCERVVGIDVSEASISHAQRNSVSSRPIDFLVESVEDLAARTEEKFDAVIANMMLMSSPDLMSSIGAMTRLLNPVGRLIITITHPWFWPNYWGYESAPWFRYDREIILEAPFAISADGPSPFLITHIHRPLERYINALLSFNLCVTDFEEPSPPLDAPLEYRKTWHFPRFLALSCKRGSV